MKRILFFLAFLPSLLVAQQMRDSTYTIPVTARQCVISVSYAGVVVRDTLSPEEVAAWIHGRGVSSPDSLRPIQDAILSHLNAEVERLFIPWQAEMTAALATLDPDVLTQTEMRVGRVAVRQRSRTWQYVATKKVPVVEGMP